MDDEFKWLLKEGDGCIFKSCDISCEPYSCTHAVILQCLFCDTLAYTITANGVCLHLLVFPVAASSVLLA